MKEMQKEDLPEQCCGRVESYIPTATFYNGKREAAGREFHNRFAVVDVENAFSIVAARGADLPVGYLLRAYAQPEPLVRQAILSGKRVVADLRDGSVLYFGDRSFCGLTPALLLPDTAAQIARAAERLGRFDILPLSFPRGEEGTAQGLRDVCRRLERDFAECDRIFESSSPEWSRRHAALIAEFAGCRGNFGELPPEPFLLAEQDERKWTILLLCLFLTLRGVSAREPKLSMRELGRETIVTGMDFLPADDAKRELPQRFGFLKHPAFQDVILEETPAGIRFSVLLSQKRSPMEVRAFSVSTRFCFLVETA